MCTLHDACVEVTITVESNLSFHQLTRFAWKVPLPTESPQNSNPASTGGPEGDLWSPHTHDPIHMNTYIQIGVRMGEAGKGALSLLS